MLQRTHTRPGRRSSRPLGGSRPALTLLLHRLRNSRALPAHQTQPLPESKPQLMERLLGAPTQLLRLRLTHRPSMPLPMAQQMRQEALSLRAAAHRWAHRQQEAAGSAGAHHWRRKRMRRQRRRTVETTLPSACRSRCASHQLPAVKHQSSCIWQVLTCSSRCID